MSTLKTRKSPKTSPASQVAAQNAAQSAENIANAEYIKALEGIGAANGKAKNAVSKADASFAPIIAARVAAIAPTLEGVALEMFKREAKSHIICGHMTANECGVTYDDVRKTFDYLNASGELVRGVVAKIAGKALAVGANDPDVIAAFQSAYDLANGSARTILTRAFTAAKLDVKTGRAPVTETNDRANAGQGKVESGAGAGGVSPEVATQIIKSAPKADLEGAVFSLPENDAIDALIQVALKLMNKGLTQSANVHFVNAMLEARANRAKELATPATKCA